MTNVTGMYALGHDELATLIRTMGAETTIVVQGHMGSGKSSLLRTLSAQLPGYTPLYFDCTTKDLGDMMLPKIKDLDGNDYVRFATNEELGLHLQQTPAILMLDEVGKNKGIMNALLRLMQERQLGSYALHPETLLFATTNLGIEGVGDLLPPHARNRVILVEARKPTATEWLEWGINNNLEPIVLGWVRENPHCFDDFRTIKNPDDNPYIYHPRATDRTSFVTGRSLEKASKLLAKRQLLGETTTTAALIGTIGLRAAMDMAAFIKLADKLPTLKSIKETPEKASVPDSASAITMVVFRALASVERDWLDAWMVYLNRLPAEAQGMFITGVRARGYAKAGMVMTNKSVVDWARKNNYMFGADI